MISRFQQSDIKPRLHKHAQRFTFSMGNYWTKISSSRGHITLTYLCKQLQSKVSIRQIIGHQIKKKGIHGVTLDGHFWSQFIRDFPIENEFRAIFSTFFADWTWNLSSRFGSIYWEQEMKIQHQFSINEDIKQSAAKVRLGAEMDSDQQITHGQVVTYPPCFCSQSDLNFKSLFASLTEIQDICIFSHELRLGGGRGVGRWIKKRKRSKKRKETYASNK